MSIWWHRSLKWQKLIYLIYPILRPYCERPTKFLFFFEWPIYRSLLFHTNSHGWSSAKSVVQISGRQPFWLATHLSINYLLFVVLKRLCKPQKSKIFFFQWFNLSSLKYCCVFDQTNTKQILFNFQYGKWHKKKLIPY